MERLLVLCMWLQFAAATVLFGSSLFRLLLGRDAAAIETRLQSWLGGAAFLALLSAVGWLMLEAGGMGEGWPDTINLSTNMLVLRTTEFGHVWAVRLAIAFLLTAITAARASVAMRNTGLVCAAFFLASLSLAGHSSMESGMAGLLHRANEAAHLLSGGAWIGALLPLLFSLRRGSEELAATAVRRFSGLGYAAVALVVASGLVNTWFLVKSPAALVSTGYGRVLLIKLSLVGGMLACAAVNRFRLSSRLGEGSAVRRHLIFSVVIETSLALAVLATASYLGSLAPAL